MRFWTTKSWQAKYKISWFEQNLESMHLKQSGSGYREQCLLVGMRRRLLLSEILMKVSRAGTNNVKGLSAELSREMRCDGGGTVNNSPQQK